MKAFILAAGKGKRLLPLTQKLPKPMVPVNGIPLLCYTLARLRQAGIHELIINTWYLGDIIAAFLAHHNNFGFDISLSEETELLGTGGGISNCKELLKDTFLLINADIICDIPLTEFIKFQGNKGDISLLAVSAAGKPTVAVKGDQVKDFSNIIGTDLVDCCAYTGNAILTPEIFQCLPSGYSSLVTSGFIPLSIAGHLSYWTHQGWWLDVGKPQRLKDAEIFLETKKDINKLFTSLEFDLDQDYLNWMFQNSLEV
ncbi:MAG: nucleotidyltransferase family protein [Candidatus Stygibacter frigidus]|nr:nucleotidyltransferase family protein [Candidatus Stygibacter frigidus]